MHHVEQLISKVRHYLATLNGFLSRYPYIVCLFLMIGIALLAITRRPDIFFNAQFWAEDGAVWYTAAYHNGFWQTILQPYPEYLAIPQRIIAYFSTLGPLSAAPLFLNIAGLAFQLLPIFIIASGRLKAIISSPLSIIATCIVLIGLPNTAEVFSAFANTQWHLSLAALLIIIAGPAQNRRWRIFDIVVLVAAGLAGPNAIFLIPIAALRWWFAGRHAQYLQNLVLVCALAVMQILTIAFSDTQRTGTPPDANVITLVKMIAGQIYTGGILGQGYIDLFYKQEFYLCLVFAAGLALTAYAILKAPLWLKLLNIYVPLVLATLLITLKNAPGTQFDAWWGLTNPTGGQRYWYIPIFVWLATIAWIALKAKSRLAKWVSIALLGLLFTIGLPQGWVLTPLKDNNFSEHAAHFNTLPRGAEFSAPINPAGWQIKLYKK